MNPDEFDKTLESDYLKTVVRNVADLTDSERNRLYDIMSDYFDGIDRGRFLHDLNEKERVLLSKSVATGEIRGFSTLARWNVEIDNEPLTVYFSGDTVIDPAYWGRNDGVRVWLRHVMQEVEDASLAYWLLLTSTYVSYLFLPRLFKEYYPTPHGSTSPEMKRLIDELTRRKFPDEYDAERGVVVLEQPTPVRSGGVMMDAKLEKDPHVAYFFAKNPGHANSDYLACIAELNESNLTALGRRLISN